jgi:hypothetical protein
LPPNCWLYEFSELVKKARKNSFRMVGYLREDTQEIVFAAWNEKKNPDHYRGSCTHLCCC